MTYIPIDNDVTQLLDEWHQGNKQALDKLTPVVHEELHRLAVQFMQKETDNHTLQATALVNEAFIKLAGIDIKWQDKVHFISMAARIMRNILVDHAKSKNAHKRQTNKNSIEFNDEIYANNSSLEELITIDELLDKLCIFDERASKIVELTLFGGLTQPEISELLQLSISTVERELRIARAWINKHR